MSRFLYRLGRAAVQRRHVVVLAWLIAGIGAIGLSQAAGSAYSNNLTIPDSETQRATDLLRDRFPAFAGGSAVVVFHARTSTLADPTTAAAIGATLDRVRALPKVVAVSDPLSPESLGQVSADGTIAYADIRYGVPSLDVGKAGMDALKAAIDQGRSPALQIELGGEVVNLNADMATSAAEVFGVGLALVVLLVAFGSLIAAGLPILTALFGIVVGISVVGLLAHIAGISTFGPILAMMLGLGAGIDYALFVVTRHRELLRQGLSVEEAAGRANATAGLAVVFAGSTVIIAILGLWLTGVSMVASLGFAAAFVVASTVLAAISLLPALLGFAGERIDRFALRLPGARSGTLATATPGSGAGAWAAWSRGVVHHPWLSLIGSAGVLLLLATPVLTLRLGQPDAGNESTSDTQRRAYDLLAEGFGPGFNGPLLVVLSLPAGDGPANPANAAFMERIATTVGADPAIAAVGPAIPSETGDTAILTAIPRTAPQDPDTERLILRLRGETLPPLVTAAGSGAGVLVTGPTAALVDLAQTLADRLPLFIGAVVLLSCLLLALVFRSIVVPLTAAVLNLLSIGAAYGVVVAIFQWGWGIRLIGLEGTVPIISFVPVLMFAILFGLSMDYHVFLLSRIREEYLRTGDERESVVVGLAGVGRVIASAALVMVCVFLAFAATESPLTKMMAIGAAAAVLADATLTRMILVPAAMTLLGRANWWLPAWLDRVMPRLMHDSGRPMEPAGAVSGTMRAGEASAGRAEAVDG